MWRGLSTVALALALVLFGGAAHARGLHREQVVIDVQTGATHAEPADGRQGRGMPLVSPCFQTLAGMSVTVTGTSLQVLPVGGATFTVPIPGDSRNRLNWVFVRGNVAVVSVVTFPSPASATRIEYLTLGISLPGGNVLWRRPTSTTDSRCWDLDGVMVLDDFRSVTRVDVTTGANSGPTLPVSSSFELPVRVGHNAVLVRGRGLALVDTVAWRVVWQIAEESFATPLVSGSEVYTLALHESRGAADVSLVVHSLADGHVLRRFHVIHYSSFFDRVTGEIEVAGGNEVRARLAFIVLD